MSCHIQGNLHKIISSFSTENLQARRKWDDTFKVLKEKLPTKNTIPGKAVLQK